MKTRLAAIAMILIGVGAVALAIVGPSFAGSSSSKYITSTATVGTVSATSVATGTVQASTVYGFKFGQAPDIVSTSQTSSGTGGSTSANNSSANSSVVWPVQTVSVTVGQSVKKGDTLATAESSAAQLTLSSAQATLASAQAKLTTDQGGVDPLTKAQAANQLSQATNSYKQAVANKKLVYAQSALKLSTSKQAVTAAQAKLAADTPGTTQYDTDAAALATAQSNYSSTVLQLSQANQQASQQVANASLSLQSAKLAYQGKLAPASSATIQADQAAVATAQQAVDAAQLAVTGATITAPADGLIVAVNILAGVNAPSSSYAIEESITPMVATASFTETDITGIKLGQPAVVTVTAPKVQVAATVSQISPVASTTGGSSSVVTYSVVVTLADPPASVLAGMTATVSVTTASVDNAVRIPATALIGSAANGYSVLVMNSDGSVSSRSVQVGLVTTSMAQITNGISEGEAVVTGTVSNRTGTSSNGLGGGGINSLTGGGGGFRFSGPGQ
jgi:multidrug efflux pump subunit AcrA (membrane-fusion protein)